MTVSTLPSKMQFQIILQNKGRVWAAAKSAVQPETRNLDLVGQGKDRSKMIEHPPISILDLVREEVASTVVPEGGEAEAEAEAPSGLGKTNECLRAINLDIGGFRNCDCPDSEDKI